MRTNFLKTAFLVLSAAMLFPGVSSAGFLKPKRGGSSSGSSSSSGASASSSGSSSSDNTSYESKAPAKSASQGTSPDTTIYPGTYETINLGTAGGHRNDPGSTGPMTISSDGKISGSLFNFNDGSTDTVTGTVDLTTGNGSVKVTNSKGGNTDSYNITLKTTTRKYSFMEGTYDKVGSSSKGIFFGLKKTD